MDLLYSVFFGAGVAGFIYTKMGRRLGSDNSKSTWTVAGITFVLVTIVFYTIMATILHIH